MEKIITSTQNPKVKQAFKLKKAAKRKKEDLFLIEGYKEIFIALKAGIEIKTIFLCDEYVKDKTLLNKTENKTVIKTTSNVFNKLSRSEKPDGWLAVARTYYLRLEEIELSLNPLVVVLEALEKPGNLGAVLRSAEAAGVDAVIVSEPRADIYNPNVIRSSRGTVFLLPIVVADNNKVNEWLIKNSIKSYAATSRADKLYTEANFSGPTAIIIGNEHEGLSKYWLGTAQEKIKIPIQGKVNSLNASVSAAILIYEALRQRFSNQGTIN